MHWLLHVSMMLFYLGKKPLVRLSGLWKYQVLGSINIPVRLKSLDSWEFIPWPYSVDTTCNTIIRLGYSRIEYSLLILHGVAARHRGRAVIICVRYDKCLAMQSEIHNAHCPLLQHSCIHHQYAEMATGIMCDQLTEARWSLRSELLAAYCCTD